MTCASHLLPQTLHTSPHPQHPIITIPPHPPTPCHKPAPHLPPPPANETPPHPPTPVPPPSPHPPQTTHQQVKDTPEAPTLAQANLKAMGPMSKGELITLATISGAVVLWMFGDAIGCPAVLAAMLALGTLLCTGEGALLSSFVCVWGVAGGVVCVCVCCVLGWRQNLCGWEGAVRCS